MENIENIKQIKLHKENYLMYEKTKKEVVERMSEAMNDDGSKKYTQEQIDERIDLIQKMQDDVKQKFLISGGDLKDLENNNESKQIKSKTNKKTPIKPLSQTTKTIKNNTTTRPPIIKKEKENNEMSEKITDVIKQNKTVINNLTDNQESIPVVPSSWSNMNFNESFDVIPLPSKGQCYENNMSTIAVSYLTANDENMIVSPNLYRDGLILDYLLRAKIKNQSIDPDDLLEGDREAIILWLRATSYGTQYPITVTDNKTGTNFDTVLDLTQIKHKPFVLEGDGNGCFDFELPVSKDTVKFRFLTHGDIKQIDSIEKLEQPNIKKQRLLDIVDELNTFIENEDNLSKDDKQKIYESKRAINKWANSINVDDDLGYTHKLTNRLELSIVSINNNKDRNFISEYVQTMNVQDALALRRHIAQNEPGLDYAVTVERPESLGGGSMPVFLSLDEYIFLNIT